MVTIQCLMTVSECRELSQMAYVKFQEIEPILKKDFADVTVKEIHVIAQTSIFDLNFTDLLFAELLKRYNDHERNNVL